MTPADYLCFIVMPTLTELLAEPADQRRAYLACVTAAHARSVALRRGSEHHLPFCCARAPVAVSTPETM